jgi:hypothetical protein
LCIIHNKIYHSKIVILWLQVKNKMVLGSSQLRFTLIKIITHRHEDEEFVKYSNEFQPNDLNFIIKLLLQLLWALEKNLISESKILFEFEPQNSFFWQLCTCTFTMYIH